MNEIKQLAAQIKALSSEQQAELSVELEKPQEWENWWGVYYIDSSGSIDTRTSTIGYSEFGSEAKTKNDAKYLARNYKLLHALVQCHKEIVGDWVPDWNDFNQSKWYPSYSNHYKKWELMVGDACCARLFHFPTKEAVAKFIKLVGDKFLEFGK